MRAVALHTSRLAQTQAIPDLLIRDLLIVVLLTDGDERQSARSRLDDSLGSDLTDQLLAHLQDPGAIDDRIRRLS